MLIVDNVSRTKNGMFRIPRYHSGHLSLQSETVVTVCLLPPGPSHVLGGMRELVVSPVLFNSWQHLARVSAVMNDEPGVVRKLAHAIMNQGLDVMYEESATIENGQYHRVEMIVDPYQLYWDHSARNADTSDLLSALSRRLKADCLDELVIEDGHPRLKVRPMEGLRNAWRAVRSYPGNFPDKANVTFYERAVIVSSSLTIPQSILEAIGQPSPRIILVSDTRDRILRVLIPSPSTHFTYVRINHLDTIGSFFRIADRLSRHFNAVQTLTRLKSQGKHNDVELLLHCQRFPSVSEERKRKDLLETLLSEPDLKGLHITVSYPERAGDRTVKTIVPKSHPQMRRIKPIRAVPLETGPMRQSTAEVLRAKSEVLKARLKQDSESLDAGNKGDLVHRFQAAEALLRVENVGYTGRPTIFVAFCGVDRNLYEIVEATISHDESVVSNGDNPNNRSRPYRNKIRDRIRYSHGFVVIWNEDSKYPVWLTWELGVAQSFGIPVLVLAREGAGHSFLDVVPEVNYQKFRNAGDLASNFRQSWKDFKPDVEGHYRRTIDGRIIDRLSEDSSDDDVLST